MICDVILKCLLLGDSLLLLSWMLVVCWDVVCGIVEVVYDILCVEGYIVCM